MLYFYWNSWKIAHIINLFHVEHQIIFFIILGLSKTNLDVFGGALAHASSFLPSQFKSQLFDFGKSVGSYHLKVR